MSADVLPLFPPKPAEPIGDSIVRRAVFTKDRACRFSLTRIWGDSNAPRPLWLGHNPSDASETRDDPTSWRIIHFCRRWGQPGYDLGNLYPFVTSDPAECRRIADWEANGPDWWARDQLWHNLSHLEKLAAKASMIVACFGDIARDQDWIDHVIEEISCAASEPVPIYCLGTTKSGAPKHPMARGKHRVPNDQQPIIWRE